MADLLRPALLHILQHSLGLDDYGRGEAYRNHFSSGPSCDHYVLCRELVVLGLMVEHPPRAGVFPDSTFVVTDEGRAAVRGQSPKPQKLTRGQKRYREWLRADIGIPFGEWIRRTEAPHA